jgi:hypothetical protein
MEALLFADVTDIFASVYRVAAGVLLAVRCHP